MDIRKILKARPDEVRYLVLFVITISLVVWRYFGMSIELHLLPDTEKKFMPAVHDDHINGGRSVTEVSHPQGNIQLDCKIVLSDTFAFCGVEIPLLTNADKGIDLSRFDRMHVEFTYQSDSSDTLLLYMINQEQDQQGKAYMKSNLWPVRVVNGDNAYDLSIGHFFVPSWWIYQNNQPGVNYEPDITNVVALQITTGDNTAAREASFNISRISFHGKWLGADQLYAGLLVAWVLLLSFHGLRQMRQLSIRFKQSRLENAHLKQLNAFLSIQKDQFESLAKHDKLTGAWNRAGVRDILSKVSVDYRQGDMDFSLLILDLDHFKEVNDDFGHNVGDNVLKEFVQLITTHTRDSDTVVRWGGEEFVLICPETDLKRAVRLAEILRTQVERTTLLEGRQVTCSIGVAQFRGEHIKEWFNRADAALYQAKKDGRNCVRSAD